MSMNVASFHSITLCLVVLQKLMQLPTVSGSIEVWDFLSVDSQTYLFSNSFSVIETLSVDLENKPSEKAKKLPNFLAPVTNNLSSRREHLSTESKESAFKIKNNVVADVLRSNEKDSRTQNHAASLTNSGNTAKGRDGDGLEEASESLLDATTDPTLPTEVTLIFALVMM
jgi:sorting nexin-13